MHSNPYIPFHRRRWKAFDSVHFTRRRTGTYYFVRIPVFDDSKLVEPCAAPEDSENMPIHAYDYSCHHRSPPHRQTIQTIFLIFSINFILCDAFRNIVPVFLFTSFSISIDPAENEREALIRLICLHNLRASKTFTAVYFVFWVCIVCGWFLSAPTTSLAAALFKSVSMELDGKPNKMKM